MLVFSLPPSIPAWNHPVRDISPSVAPCTLCTRHEHDISVFVNVYLQQGTTSRGLRGCDGRVHHPRPAAQRRGLRGGARRGKDGGPGTTTVILL